MNYDEKCQLMIIGDSLVGKTSLLYRYQENKFMNNYLATVGIDFFTKEEIFDGKKVRIKIWDTAGQERFKSLTQAFSRNADGIILVFDVSNRESFENLRFWIGSINSNLGHNNEILKIIVGNKIDLISDIQKGEAEEYAKINNCAYFETSAKENKGIQEAIRYLVGKLISNKNTFIDKERDSLHPIVSRGSRLDNQNNEEGKNNKKCSC